MQEPLLGRHKHITSPCIESFLSEKMVDWTLTELSKAYRCLRQGKAADAKSAIEKLIHDLDGYLVDIQGIESDEDTPT